MADHPDHPTEWRPDSDRRWICDVGALRVGDPQGDRSEGEGDRTSNRVSHRVWRRDLRANHYLWTDASCTRNQLSVHLFGTSVSVPDDLRTAGRHVRYSSFAVRRGDGPRVDGKSLWFHQLYGVHRSVGHCSPKLDHSD